MLEVLVSLTIVAFGVLGLLGLQARALSFQKDSFDRRTAAEMVAQLAERIRANHMGLVNGDYDSDRCYPCITCIPRRRLPSLTRRAEPAAPQMMRRFVIGLSGSPSSDDALLALRHF